MEFSEFWEKQNELVTFYPVVNMPLGLGVVEPVDSIAAIIFFCCANTPILCATFLFVNTAPLCVMSKCCCDNTACQQPWMSPAEVVREGSRHVDLPGGKLGTK